MLRLVFLFCLVGSLHGGLLRIVHVCEECLNRGRSEYFCESGHERPVLLVIRCRASLVRTGPTLVVSSVDTSHKVGSLVLAQTTLSCKEVMKAADVVLLDGKECIPILSSTTSRRPRLPIPVPVPVHPPRRAEPITISTSSSTVTTVTSKESTSLETTSQETTSLRNTVRVIGAEVSVSTLAVTVTVTILLAIGGGLITMRLVCRRRRRTSLRNASFPIQDRAVTSTDSFI